VTTSIRRILRQSTYGLPLIGVLLLLAGSAHGASLASCSNGCLLKWTVQPSNAVVNDVITDTAFSAKSGATSKSVQVTVVDNTDATITNARGTVSLAKNAGTFDTPPCASFLSGATASLDHGVATFGSLSAGCSGKLFTLTATSSAGYTSAVSGSFSIFQTYVPCNAGNPNCQSTLDLGGSGDAGLTTSTSGSFTFLALAGGTLSLPGTGSSGAVICRYWLGSLTNGFREVDQSGGSGTTKLFTYYVSQSLLKARYGKNTGQQFVPMCAGGARVDLSGHVVYCTTPGSTDGGWWGESLNPDGSISGILKQAICGDDGLWWGFMPSFQDFNNTNFGAPNTAPPPDFSWSTNPVITGWSSCTAGSTCPAGVGTPGATYRSFNISIPSPWDWGGGM
jgi:hypothetical protein